MKKYLLTLALAATTSGLWADERLPLLRAGLSTYTNVTVYSVSATDIYFSHAGGMGNAKLKDLDRTLQKHFNYNPTDAAVTAKQQTGQKPVAKQAGANAVRAASDEADIRAPEIYARSFLGKQPPAFTVEKWLTSKPATTGKFVLIDFWATWCGPCRKAIPHLNALQAKFGDRLVVVGLSDESEQEVRKMTSPKMEYSVAIDTRQQMMSQVEVRGIPHAILIDPKGIVRFEGMPHYLTDQGLERLLNKYGQ